MKDISSIETLQVPEGVTVALKARTITVEGPRGSLTKNVGHIAMDIQLVSEVLPGVLGMRDRMARVGTGAAGRIEGVRATRSRNLGREARMEVLHRGYVWNSWGLR